METENTCLTQRWEQEVLFGMPSPTGTGVERTRAELDFGETFEVGGGFIFPERIHFFLANGTQATFRADKRSNKNSGSFSAVVAYRYIKNNDLRIAVKCSTEGVPEAELARQLLEEKISCGQVGMTFLGANEKATQHYYAMPYLFPVQEASLGIENLREATEHLRKQLVCLLERKGVPYLDVKVQNVMFRPDTNNSSMCLYLVDLASLLVHNSAEGEYLLCSFPPPETISPLGPGRVLYTENRETNLKYLSWCLGVFALQVSNPNLASRLHHEEHNRDPSAVKKALGLIQSHEFIPNWIKHLLHPNHGSRLSAKHPLWSPDPKGIFETLAWW